MICMLQVDAKNRITAEELFKALTEMSNECVHDDSYFCQPGAQRYVYRRVPSLSQRGTDRNISELDPPGMWSEIASQAPADSPYGTRFTSSPTSTATTTNRRKRANLGCIVSEYSCPFRKRNPLRFNVRDYQTCALSSFPDISQVK